MDSTRERVVSEIEKRLIGNPSSFSAEISHDDLRFVGRVVVENYLTENGYKLNGAIVGKGKVILFGSYNGGSRDA